MIKRSLLNVDESRTKEFWLSHILIVIATVAAVYLAASAGLKSAVSFELIKSDKDSYYMRTALLSELEENLNNMEQWAKAYRSGKAGDFWRNPEDYQMSFYVWEAVKEQPMVFEIPSNILTPIRKYYQNSTNVLSKMTSRKPVANEVDALLVQTKEMKEKSLVDLKSNIEVLKKKLVEYEIL